MPIHFCIYKYYNAQDFFKSLIEFINDYTLVLISIPLFWVYAYKHCKRGQVIYNCHFISPEGDYLQLDAVLHDGFAHHSLGHERLEGVGDGVEHT